jgi:hypothetical protein
MADVNETHSMLRISIVPPSIKLDTTKLRHCPFLASGLMAERETLRAVRVVAPAGAGRIARPAYARPLPA